MICPKCKTEQFVDKSDIRQDGSTFRCHNCNVVLAVKKSTREPVSDDAVLQTDRKGTVLGLKGRLKGISTSSSDVITGKNIFEVMPSDIAQLIMQHIERAFHTGNLQSFEYHASSSDTHSILKCIAHGHDRAIVIISDISAYKKAAERVNYLAYHDTLTDVPNRYLFHDRLNQAIALMKRANKSLAILFLDLDNFKQINDALGHKAGDQLLRSVAGRLMTCVRATDSITHLVKEEADLLVARLGGDEFTILLNRIESIEEPAIVAGRIFKTLAEPFQIGANEVNITASIGIAVYPFDGTDLDTLLINADVAMYQAKNQGRNCYQYYSASMNKFTFERFRIENKLRRALEHNEFMLFYQPQVNIQTGSLIGVEALIRWLQPDLVLTRPGEFIPLAEQTGLIISMGDWILRTACEQNKIWQKAGLTPMLMTVNISSIQFRQDNFMDLVSQILRDTDLDPRYLQLELTESTIMQNSESTIRKLRTLHEMGVQTSIDDFGTGYSSLKYLKHFPLDTLKIDTSFIKEVTTSPSDQSIVKAIITLAHNFNLKVVAEGVEEQEQLTYLRESGCEAVQGYLICPPVNSGVLAQFTKKKTFFKA